jgi:hypothetical protein
VGLSATGGNRVANWNVPNVATKNAFLRNIQGTDTAIAGPFIILNAPNNLNLDWACPDSIKISFSPVTGATDYTAYILGTTYMDSVYSGTATSMIIPYQPVNGTWLSVSGGINNVQGRRAYAVQLPSGTNACPLPRDGGISALLSPQFITSCQNPVQQVSITVTNPSTQVLDTLPVAMTFGTTDGARYILWKSSFLRRYFLHLRDTHCAGAARIRRPSRFGLSSAETKTA